MLKAVKVSLRVRCLEPWDGRGVARFRSDPAPPLTVALGIQQLLAAQSQVPSPKVSECETGWHWKFVYRSAIPGVERLLTVISTRQSYGTHDHDVRMIMTTEAFTSCGKMLLIHQPLQGS